MESKCYGIKTRCKHPLFKWKTASSLCNFKINLPICLSGEKSDIKLRDPKLVARPPMVLAGPKKKKKTPRQGVGESFARHLGIRVFHAKILNLKLRLMNQVIQEHCGNDCLEPRLGCCQLEMDGWISTRPLFTPVATTPYCLPRETLYLLPLIIF